MKDLFNIILENCSVDFNGDGGMTFSQEGLTAILKEFGENIKHIEQFPTEGDNNFPVTQYIDFQLIKAKSILK